MNDAPFYQSKVHWWVKTTYVDIMHLSHFKVTECDTRKTSRLPKLSFFRKISKGVDPPHVEKASEECVKEVELAHYIYCIHDLHYEIQTWKAKHMYYSVLLVL